MNDISLRFAGAAETVTGSKFLLSADEDQILVDCGLFQGIKKLRERNWADPDFRPSAVDSVLLTHGHLDHVGYLPRLVKCGFDGPIRGTAPTLDIAEIILKDSAKIQEEEAKRANRKGYSKHDPARPLYTVEDAEQAIDQFDPQPANQWIDVGAGISYRHRRAGHILGATFLEVNVDGTTITFSGDLGRPSDPLLDPPEAPTDPDYLLLESTYGDRCHPDEDTLDRLEDIIQQTVSRGGNVLVPSFAVEKAQLLMYLLWTLRKQDRIPDIPMYLDTPMGTNVARLFDNHHEWHRLDRKEWRTVTHLFEPVETVSENRSVAKQKGSKLVIAGSGMLTGGRILDYLRYDLSDPNSTLVLTGYQAEGTRGRNLQDGADQIKFHGKYWPVKLRVEQLDDLSAHADQQELVDWCSSIEQSPENVFLVHGSPGALDALRVRLHDQFGWNASIPEHNDVVTL